MILPAAFLSFEGVNSMDKYVPGKRGQRIDPDDIVGKQFGNLLVGSYLGKHGKDHTYMCTCSCGSQKTVSRSNLISGNTTGCGCRKNNYLAYEELVGKEFGNLTVLEYAGQLDSPNEGHKRSTYRCKCKCGNEVFVTRVNLLSGKQTSCGNCQSIIDEGRWYRYVDSAGDSFIFDKDDLVLARSYTWKVNPYGYAAAKENKKTLIFSRLLLAAGDGEFVDHINGDTRDNRKENLRLASKLENQRNMRIPIHNSSGYKGVSYRTDRGKYRAYISIHNRLVHLGYFEKAEEAAHAYDEAARFFYGEFACVNFPQMGEQGCLPDKAMDQQKTA